MNELSNPTLSLDILNFFCDGDNYHENITIHELQDLIQKPNNINPVIFTEALSELTEHRYLIMKEVKFMVQNEHGMGSRSGVPQTYFITEKGKNYLESESMKRLIVQTKEFTTEPIIAPINKFMITLSNFIKSITLAQFIWGVITSLVATAIASLWQYFSR